MLSRGAAVCLAVLSLLVGGLTAPCQAQQPPSQAVGLTLQALSDADLNTMEAKTGHRVGVIVKAVTPGSPAAAAGLRAGNLLFLVDKSPVASPADVDKALTGKTGEVRVGGLRVNAKGEGETFECKLLIAAGGIATAQAPVDVQEELKALDAALQAGVLSEAEYQQKKAALLGAATGQGGVAPASTDGLAEFADPQGRFYLRYPAGWTPKARDDNSGVDLAKGNVAGSVLAFAGQGTAQQLLNAFADPVSKQTKEYKVINQGEAVIGGDRGPTLEYTGTNPDGVRCHALMAAVAGGGTGVLFMLVAPEGEFDASKSDWAKVLRHFSRERPATTGGAGAAPPSPGADPLTAYLDMLDFMRSQAWGKQLSTPAADRQRLLVLLQQADEKTRQNVTQGLQGVPQIWADLQRKWAAASDQKRAEQQAFWRKQMLLPAFIYPPPPGPETFKGRGDHVVFEHPKGWVVAQTEDEGNQYLYLGPPGTQANWDQVLDPAKSPPGAFFAVMPLPDELKQVEYIEGARMMAGQYVRTPGANLTELSADKLGEGAILVLRGTYPGSNEERFYWVGLVKYGADHILAGRLGGPVAMADQLVPAFSHMIMTMELRPPEGDGGEGGAMVDYYTSRLGNIVVSSGW